MPAEASRCFRPVVPFPRQRLISQPQSWIPPQSWWSQKARDFDLVHGAARFAESHSFLALGKSRLRPIFLLDSLLKIILYDKSTGERMNSSVPNMHSIQADDLTKP